MQRPAVRNFFPNQMIVSFSRNLLRITNTILVKEYHSEAVGTGWVVTKVLGDTMTSSTVWHGPCTSAPMEEMNRGQCPHAASPGRLVFPAEEGSS